MNIWFLILAGSASGLTSVAAANHGQPAPNRLQTGVLLDLHFTGTRALAAGEDGAQMRKIWVLPETESLRNQTLERLARAPGALYPGRLSPVQVDQGVALLLPLLRDLIDNEFMLELREGNPAPEWTLAVALDPGRRAEWQTNLPRLLETWKLGDTATPAREEGGWTRLQLGPGRPAVRWAEARGWFLLGVGHGSLSGSEARFRRVQAEGRPVAGLDRVWLGAGIDLTKLAAPLGLPAPSLWPRVHLEVEGRKADLVTRMTLDFAEPVSGALGPWQIPTNSICEPLASFTGVRGVAPWLERLEVVKRLGLAPVPDQIYAWSQSVAPVHATWAFPFVDATNWVSRMATVVPGLLGPAWRERNLAQVEWQSAQTTALWKGLPIVVPYLRPTRDSGLDYVVGGLFPLMVTTNPAPVELLAQLAGRPDLLGYSWEMTGVRLAQWRFGAQLAAIIVNQPQFTTNTAALPWLMSVEKQLGNTITEITAHSPKQWSVIRRSHVGFGGAELVLLARWLESVQFPRLGLELPDPQPHPAHKRAAPEPAKTAD